VLCRHWAMSPCCHLCACRRCLFVVVMCCILVVSSFHVGATSLSSSWVLLSPRCCHPHVLSSRVLVVSFLCRGLLVLCLSHLSHCCPCPSCVIVVPCHRSVVVLCVSKVGWDEHGGGGVLTRVPRRRLCPFVGAGHHLCSFSGVLRHLGLHWWSLWLVMWCCHVAVGCSIVGCVPWL